MTYGYPWGAYNMEPAYAVYHPRLTVTTGTMDMRYYLRRLPYRAFREQRCA